MSKEMRKNRIMSVGKALLRVRLDRKMTQREVADRADLAVSYVSRIENNRVQPTTGTLNRLAEALEMPVSGIFAIGEAVSTPVHKCPVSASGKCVGESIRSGLGPMPKGKRASYGEEELRLLRMADFLVLHGSKEVQMTLSVMLESLLTRVGGRFRGKKIELQK